MESSKNVKSKKVRLKKPDFLYPISKEIHTFEMCNDVGLAYFTTDLPRVKVALDYCTNSFSERHQIKQSMDVAKLMSLLYSTVINDCEHFVALYLNKRNCPIGYYASEGLTSSVLVDVRKIMIAGLMLNASGIILIHNHPSGNLSLSERDNEIFESFKSISDVMGVTCLDNIILTMNGYYSCSDGKSTSLP